MNPTVITVIPLVMWPVHPVGRYLQIGIPQRLVSNYKCGHLETL